MTDEELMRSTPEDQAFWLRCVQGLPGLEGFSGTGYDARGERIPWGSGPHNVQAYMEIIDIVKPHTIFEIGFNLGYATSMWLELSGAKKIFTIDISDKPETLKAAEVLKARYGDRFEFMCIDSAAMGYNALGCFDMAFIDGGHLEEHVTNDIKLCLDAGIEWLVMDDWQPNFGPGVQISVQKFPLEVVKVWGNTALVKAI
jgi:hypothetical protein